MNKHFKEHEGEYLLSPAAGLTLIAAAVNDSDASPAGRLRAERVIDSVVAAARSARFEQADILETMLALNTKPARLLPLFEALVKTVGAERVAQIIHQGLTEVRGDQA